MDSLYLVLRKPRRPPSPQLEALAIGRSAALHEILDHAGLPPIPLVLALPALLLQRGLHALDEAHARLEGRLPQALLVRRQHGALGLLLPAGCGEGQREPPAAEVPDLVAVRAEGPGGYGAGGGDEAAFVEGAFDPQVVVAQVGVLGGGEAGLRADDVGCVRSGHGDLVLAGVGRGRGVRQERSEDVVRLPELYHPARLQNAHRLLHGVFLEPHVAYGKARVLDEDEVELCVRKGKGTVAEVVLDEAEINAGGVEVGRNGRDVDAGKADPVVPVAFEVVVAGRGPQGSPAS